MLDKLHLCGRGSTQLHKEALNGQIYGGPEGSTHSFLFVLLYFPGIILKNNILFIET